MNWCISLTRLIALASVLYLPLAQAQTLYVIDRLAVGLHQEQSLDSAIIKVIPTGTQLEVLAGSENVLQVKTEDGLIGWVDKTYLMDEKPAQNALLELESQHIATLNELEVARTTIASLNAQLEASASAESIQASTEEATSGALREMQRLAEENQALKLELSEAAKMPGATTSTTTAPTANRSRRAISYAEGLLGLGLWHWVLIAALTLLGFGVGGYVVDWSARRRHGGFRV